jgi:hypothetical protein
MKHDLPRPPKSGKTYDPKPALTPAQRALLLAAGPTFIETAVFGPPESVLAATVEPDDWRFYYLMRELSQEDRSRILTFTELLFNLRHAQRWASKDDSAAESPHQ